MLLDELSPRQLAYKAKREEQYQQILQCIRDAGLRGIHKKAIHRALGFRERIINPMVDDMHSRKLIHIAGWTCLGGAGGVGLYAMGNKPDAPKVSKRITDKAQRQKERRQCVAALDEEAQLRMMVEKKNQAWAKEWVPHCDVAAAWMMGART
ncbi:hypothetical protein K6V90_09555 [Cupriavidus pauculus]|uniref:hypothetical protein n=1 Tax=Cupriavidus pauculus TaxID=82633 RepID=UPI001C935780|nr:hypothetical protein [Cupriavidus pauculus]MBY4730777.1 hypothetical protein [Cupriavidus pauculus]